MRSEKGGSGVVRKTISDQIVQVLDWNAVTSLNMPGKGVKRAVQNAAKRCIIYSNVGVKMRYEPMVQYIRKLAENQNLSLLEIGSGTLGITPFLKQRAVGLDITFRGPNLGYLEFVPGQATDLPFREKAFDVVLSADMLEHVDRGQRQQVVSEMFRVSRSVVIIGVPCGHDSENFESKINLIYTRKFGQGHRWLKDHLEHGLPTTDEMESLIKNAAEYHCRAYELEVARNVNLRLWYQIQLGEIYVAMLVFNAFFLNLFFFLAKRINSGSCYRRIFFISFNGSVVKRCAGR